MKLRDGRQRVVIEDVTPQMATIRWLHACFTGMKANQAGASRPWRS